MTRLNSVRPRVLVCLCMLTLFLAAPVHAQERTLSIDQRVQQAKHGPDQAGKDGPMAKASSELIRLHYEAKSGRLKTKEAEERPSPLQVGNGYVTVDALAVESGERLRDELEALGLRSAAVAGRLVSGRLPIEALDDAAALSTMRSVWGAAGGSGAGSVTSQGDVSMQTDEVRANLGVDGSNVKACVLSDSYDMGSYNVTASDDVSSGDLPSDVDVVGEAPDDLSNTDEGRAMLQIIHDIAPGATLGFHTTTGGTANYANAISKLANPNKGDCDVIVDDWIYFAEAMFQDGTVAQAIKDAVNKEGRVYVSFAGNAADVSYESEFRRSGQEISSLPCCSSKSGEMHDFDPSDSNTDVRQQITLSGGASPNLSLQWTDPYFTGNNDLDLYLIDSSNDNIVASSEGDNVNNIAAFETIYTYTNTTGSAQTLDLVITLTDNGDDQAPDLIKWVDVLSSGLTIDEYGTNSGTSFAHRNVSEAITVGAVAWYNTPDVPSGSNVTPDDPPVLNDFSSKGGVPIYFEEDGTRLPSPEFRSKPDITAPDGGENTFFGGTDFDDDKNPNFFGTSAAAPHAAGLVALMLEQAGSGDALSGSEVKTRLQESAIDIVERSGPGLSTADDEKTSIPNGQGDDIFSGAGLVQADAAAPLPVDLVAFDGQMDGEKAILSWKTASERQNSGFAVQHRSRSGSFQEVGFVEGNGTTSTTQRYRFRTGALDPGRHVFRLKQIDADGTVEYSDSIAVRRRMSGAYQLSRVAPNPATKHADLTLAVKEAQEVRAAAYNALGQRVTVLYDGQLGAKEETTLRLSDDSFASGVYFVRVEGESFSATRKVVWVE